MQAENQKKNKMNTCKQCQSPTYKPKFCSFSCATRWRNLNTNLARQGRAALTAQVQEQAAIDQ
jgi:hypothetical protein